MVFKDILLNIGNTTVQVARRGVNGPEDVRAFPVASLARSLPPLFENAGAVWCASVVPASSAVVERLAPAGVRLITWRDIPMEHLLRAPDRTGIDRFINAYAAMRAAGAPCAIADCGSALTVDVVDPDGRFAGGIIAPGRRLAEEGLRRLAQLKDFTLLNEPPLLGRDTSEAVSSGIRCGVRFLVEGYFAALRGLYPGMRFFTTGGDAGLLAGIAETTHEPLLTLKGIFLLSRENADDRRA